MTNFFGLHKMTDMETNAATAMTFDEFAALYRATFAKMMTYSPKEVGSAIYVEKLAALADAHSEWAEQVEAE